MNFSNVSDRRRDFHEKIQLMKLRHQGMPVAEALLHSDQEKLQELQEKTQKVVEELFSRLNESESQISSLAEKMVSILDTETLLSNNTEVHQQMLALKAIQRGLSESLEDIQAELEAEKKHKAELCNMLSEFRQKLKAHSGSRLVNIMYQGGERISYRIATGKPYPGDHGRPQSRRNPADKILTT